MGILLDTHTWLWYVNGEKEIIKTVQTLINDSAKNREAFIAAISLWEVSMLDARERIILEMPCLEWIKQSLELVPLTVLAMTPAIAVESCNLPGAFHEDPVDRLIVATARVEKLTLLTRDKRILAYSRQKYLSTLKV